MRHYIRVEDAIVSLVWEKGIPLGFTVGWIETLTPEEMREKYPEMVAFHKVWRRDFDKKWEEEQTRQASDTRER